jgi:hypothetical protein
MFNAKKHPHLFGMPMRKETSEYMQNKYNLTPEGEPRVKEQRPNFNPLEEKLKREATSSRSGGGGSAGALPSDKHGLDKPSLYSKGGKVVHDWHGFGKSSTGKHKHGF